MANRETFLATSANGKRIYYDDTDSHTATHFEDTPQLRELTARVLATKVLEGASVTYDEDMGEPIGLCQVVATDSSDEIVYAMRKNRRDQGYVPFTKSRPAEPSTHLSMFLAEKSQTDYELLSAWIGELESPPFPNMANATPESIPYWSKWAFVWGSQEIIPGSETTDYPWGND